MTLPANAQAHLLAAFQASIPADAVIPPETRYRIYAERVIHHPLAEWQALTVPEARTVFKHLGSEARLPSFPPWMDAPAPAPESPSSESLIAVLRRVDRRRPLNEGDRAQVLALIRQDLMHVTPEFDRTDPCPYRLTVAGQEALRTGRVAP